MRQHFHEKRRFCSRPVSGSRPRGEHELILPQTTNLTFATMTLGHLHSVLYAPNCDRRAIYPCVSITWIDRNSLSGHSLGNICGVTSLTK
jgi:hypothetical protein